jgi:mandelate racemase
LRDLSALRPKSALPTPIAPIKIAITAAIAGAAGYPLSSHLYPLVSAHLLRVSESADWLEWSDWAEPILAEPFTVNNGYATVSDKPGNSIEWNEAAIKKYAI